MFVRDGFYFWAFLLGPLWMLWRRLWLVLLLYLVGTAAVQVGLWALGVSGAVKFAVGFLIALLVGFEARIAAALDAMRAAAGPISASWSRPIAKPPSAASSMLCVQADGGRRRRRPLPRAAAVRRCQPPAPTVIGLFPEPRRERRR